MNGDVWEVELTSDSLRQFRKLENEVQKAARGLMDELESQGPEVIGAVLMRAHKKTWRAKFYYERYRMVYRVSATKTIVVTKIGPRGTIYNGMKDTKPFKR